MSFDAFDPLISQICARAFSERREAAALGDDGLLAKGLADLWRASGEPHHLAALVRLVESRLDGQGRIAGFVPEAGQMWSFAIGRPLVVLAEDGPSPHARAAAELMAQSLRAQPRLATGNYAERRDLPRQVWLDGLAAVLPFQAHHGLRSNHPRLVDDAFEQMNKAMHLLIDDATGLYFHGYDEARTEAWAEPTTGRSRAFLGPAIGLIAMAMVDLADLARDANSLQHRFDESIRDLAMSLVRHQSSDGRWYLVIDRPDQAGNYLETAGSALIAAFLLKGVRLGILDRSYVRPARHAMEALHASAVAQDAGGYVRLEATCLSTGLGHHLGRYRDGTPQAYYDEPIVADDAKGLGAVLMAVAELVRASAGTT